KTVIRTVWYDRLDPASEEKPMALYLRDSRMLHGGCVRVPSGALATGLALPVEAPIEPLSSALAAGRAMFAGSPITPEDSASSRGLRRLAAKAADVFRAFPDVVVGDRGGKHARGGVLFVQLA